MDDPFGGPAGSSGFQRRLIAFRGLDMVAASDEPKEISEELEKKCIVKFVQKGDVLYRENSTATKIYFIISGRIEVFRNKRSLFNMTSGQSFGEFPILFGDFSYIVTTVADEDSFIATIDYLDFCKLAKTYPSLWKAVAKNLATRLNDNNSKHRPHMFQKDIVFVLHGIRTFAYWQTELVKIFQDSGLAIACCNYGWFNEWRFLFLGEASRNAIIQHVESQLRQIMGNHPNKTVSVIAHSFGSYLIAEILSNNPQINVNRVLFCGSVLKSDHRFIGRVAALGDVIIVNDRGTHDLWPCVAGRLRRKIYGDIGTNGLRRGDQMKDRLFGGFEHSSFFGTSEFYFKYWIPFFKTGEIVEPESCDGKTDDRWWSKVVRMLCARGPP
jgi:CRP-like cAMP-binding protein